MLIIKSEEQFDREVLQASGPVMVDFYANWCGPCRALAPLLEEMDADTDKSYQIGKVDIDEVPELARKYSVASVPSVLIFKEGKCMGRSVGVKSRAELEGMI